MTEKQLARPRTLEIPLYLTGCIEGMRQRVAGTRHDVIPRLLRHVEGQIGPRTPEIYGKTAQKAKNEDQELYR